MLTKRTGGGIGMNAPAIIERNPQEKLIALGEALDEFRKLNPMMPVAQIQAFILAALDSDMSMLDMADRIGVKKSTASRYLLDLGPPRSDDDPAYGLIERGVDPIEPRKARYTLSKRGKVLMRRIVQILEGP